MSAWCKKPRDGGRKWWMKEISLWFIFTASVAHASQTAACEDFRPRAASAVLERASQPRSSFILITDGSAFSISLTKDLGERGAPGGVSVLTVAGDASANQTRINLLGVIQIGRQIQKASWRSTVVVASSDLLFLTVFAEAADEGRLVGSETRVLVVTSLALPEVRSLLGQSWVFSMCNAMLLNLPRDAADSRHNLFAHLPYGPTGPHLSRVASWTSASGLKFKSEVPLFPPKFDNFYGAPLNMTVHPFPPYWMEVESGRPDGSTVKRIAGRDYTMLETMAQALNFTISVMPDADWEEVILRVEQRRAFMSPMKLAIMPHLLKLYDFTTVIEPATLGFSMAKPTLKPRWQSLYYPLTDGVWASILAVLALVPVALILITKAGARMGSQSIRSMQRLVLEVAGSLVSQSSSGRGYDTSSTQVLLATWLIFSFIVSTAYRGNLTAFLTIPKYPDRPETLEQFIRTGAKATYPPDVVDFYNNFKKSDSYLYTTLASRMTLVPNFQVGLQEAIDLGQGYFYERMSLKLAIEEHFTSADGSTRLYVAGQNILPAYCAWPIPWGVPYKEKLNQFIMAFQAAGLIEKWTEDILKEARQESTAKQRRNANRKKEVQGTASDETDSDDDSEDSSSQGIMALTLTHLQGPIFLLLLGLLVSSLVFCVEILASWILKK
ncbi:Variant Ionotropic Glutamate Receptor [Penaeus vannamei]|uniref:Variant Ionotropic Glutamate Receptor n=1 Tax=Penaeus vannamei TaxID=6689 RepID=A0A3R7SMN4_PENVA|nr:Variant Ionotropic Glutamate Receptor [Penaeus vannamei]